MRLNELVREIAKREGKKSQVQVQDIREILRVLAELIAEDQETLVTLREYAQYRAKYKAVGKAGWMPAR